MRQLPLRAKASTAVAILAMLVPVAGSAQSPSAEPDPEQDAMMAVLQLMNLPPVGIMETCVPTSVTVGGAVAAVQCFHGDGVVIYVRFTDEGSLQLAYELLAEPTGLAADSGTACGEGPFEGEYPAEDGSPGGRLFCLLGPDGPMAMWTDSGNQVLGLVQQPPEVGYEGLAAAWLTARLPESSDSTPAQSAAPDASDAAPAETVAPAASDAAPAETVAPAASDAAPAESAAPAASDAAPAQSNAPAAGTVLEQWATSASASSQYGDPSWGAMQATGAPDTMAYGDIDTAWAPGGSEVGEQWIELGYDTPVVPSAVLVWETSGSGFVTKIEAWDAAEVRWVTLWSGVDDSPDERHGFSPPLEATDVVTDRLRITIDTQVLGWNEIDAVQLSGVSP